MWPISSHGFKSYCPLFIKICHFWLCENMRIQQHFCPVDTFLVSFFFVGKVVCFIKPLWKNMSFLYAADPDIWHLKSVNPSCTLNLLVLFDLLDWFLEGASLDYNVTNKTVTQLFFIVLLCLPWCFTPSVYGPLIIFPVMLRCFFWSKPVLSYEDNRMSC